MTAWLHKRKRDIDRVGEDKAPWCVGWYEPDGRRRQKAFAPGSKGKQAAFRFAKKVDAEILAQAYRTDRRVKWSQFVAEWRETISCGLTPENLRCAENAIEHFERLVRPTTVERIGGRQIDQYIARRSAERGRAKDSTVSPSTLNKELRYLRALLNVAHEWGYLPEMPAFRRKWSREPERIRTPVTPENFDALYRHCHVAQKPELPNVTPEQWWRGLLSFAYLTGWRIGEILALRWDDVDLTAGTAITRHGDNKGRRDESVGLHPVLVDLLQWLRTFEDRVFPWHLSRRRLYDEFALIREAAEVPHYGFHDLRRAFASNNAARLPAVHLQRLMRHKAFQTTQGYITLAESIQPEAADLFTPASLRKDGAG